jgi:periplasmic protein TonB
MADLSQPNNPFLSNADDHLSRLLVAGVEEPWYRSLIQNIKDTFNPPKLPPLEVTSKPVAVKDIWGLYGRQPKSFMMSTGFQIGVVALLFTVFSTKVVQDQVKQVTALVMPADLDPYMPKAAPKKQTMGGGGGGGGGGWGRWRRPVAFASQQRTFAKGFPSPVHAANGRRE